jgi:hypothetical protein
MPILATPGFTLLRPENQRPWPADKVERWAIDRLIPYAKNARRRSVSGRAT